jgi:ribosomal protein L3 glutamine methyltransferase
MTLQGWVQHCQKALEDAGLWFGHGTDNAHDEAAWLVLSAIGKKADGSFDAWGENAGVEQGKKIAALLEKRITSRQPLAYLTGETWFCDLRFIVDENVLVPRSPMAELIRRNFSPWIQADRIKTVLDLCTGSGCLGIAIARHMPWLSVDAADISRGALGVAEVNRRLHGLEDRLALIESDLFGALDGRCYDLIISNPPYVSKAVFESLPAEYHAEPGLALVSDLDGLELALRILLQSPRYLSRDGVLICEVGENAGLLETMLPTLPLSWLEFENGGGGVWNTGLASEH